MEPYNFETNVFGNLNHDKNHTELYIKNYFPEKNHLALSKQLTNNLIKFCTFKTFRPIKNIKLKVVNKCKTFIAIIKSLNLVKTTDKHSYKCEHF